MKKTWHVRSLLCLLLLSLLVSCGGGGTAEQGSGGSAQRETAEPKTEETLPPLDLVFGGKSDCRVIYPEGADSTLMAAVNRLCAALGRLTGGTFPSGDDFLPVGTAAGEREILIGKTNRPGSRQAAAELRRGEYTLERSGTGLVVCGADTDTTVQAVDRLVDLIGTNATADGFRFRPEDAYRKTGTFYVSRVTVAGAPLGAYRVVVPDAGKVEYYAAVLFCQHLLAYTGYSLPVVTDAEAVSDREIHIGKTNRDGDALPDAGRYTVRVTERGMVALASSDTGYLGLLSALRQSVFPNTKSTLTLTAGETWGGTDQTAEPPACVGTLRIMYHNTWGYLNADGSNPMANRADLALSVYRRYAPDILCLEEAGPNWETSAGALRAWLSAGYGEIRDRGQNGAGNPIYYRTETLELLESGYDRSRAGDKGTAWGVFREKATGKLFAVTNSHFAADTNAGGDATLGNTYRIGDAGVAVRVTSRILETHGEIPVISGGDFNCMQGSEPYTVLTDAGFVNLRGKAAQVSDRSPYHGSFAYNQELGVYPLQSSLPYKGELSIDHIMTRGAAAVFHCYAVVADPIALTSSDHAPHYTDLTLN